ncbi:LVIVD repeat-containing protein [Nonomuraea sp. NPDC050536]|uniref:LVIVD repeat-containing protein n=1 Tax=Nonomuraea sp. NPDC050536 TaxID=3364366 RepID=UPI0037C99556
MRRGVLAGFFALCLAACTAQPPAPPPSNPATPAAAAAAPSQSHTTIKPEDLASYDRTATHSGNLLPVAGVARRAPFDTDAAIGSDLAFTGNYAIAGNYEGFIVYDISRPERTSIVSQVYCPGPQNDVTVSGDLLFLSVDSPMTGPSCRSPMALDAGWEGIRIFDLADKRSPRYVGAVAVPCGSHTATLVPGPTPEAVYLYVSSVPTHQGVTPECEAHKGKIGVVKVPVHDPAKAALVGEPVVLPDGGTPLQRLSYGGCHDITVFTARKLAAAACIGDGLLLDIADPEHPKVLDRIQDPQHFGYWHSAVFNAAGTRVVFSDEFGGGLSIVCDPKTEPGYGGDGIYDIVDRKLKLRGYFKIPRPELEPETCSAHNGSLVPVTGRDIMVQGWYEGGASVIDFTDPAHAREIAYFERGHSPAEFGGSWSAYFYHGYIYSNDMLEGLDVLQLTGVPFAEPATTQLNAQTQ